MVMRQGLLLILWGVMVLWSLQSGRLDLLLRGVFHGLVGASGLALVVIGVLQLLQRRQRRERWHWAWIASSVMALLILLIPPSPSFSDLANNRPQGLPDPPKLAFVLPPEQRNLTEWVRLLRSQPDPDLVDGNPVNISGFVWRQPEGPPLIARLTVRCCLADATPVGIPVIWPEGASLKADEWLAVSGEMGVERVDGVLRSVVIAETVQPIPKPKRPFEP